MEYGPLRLTGFQVSQVCLGTFAAWGNPDHDDSRAPGA